MVFTIQRQVSYQQLLVSCLLSSYEADYRVGGANDIIFTAHRVLWSLNSPAFSAVPTDTCHINPHHSKVFIIFDQSLVNITL